MSTVHCLDTNIFKLNCFIEDNFLCTYNVQPLESTMKYSTILFNIAGMHTFMYRFPNKGKNAGHLQSSYYPINAPHFWVYRQQCAFPPQFTPLSDSDNIPILCPSCPVSKLIFNGGHQNSLILIDDFMLQRQKGFTALICICLIVENHLTPPLSS